MKTCNILFILILLPFLSLGQTYFVNSGARINIATGTQFNAVSANFHNLNNNYDIVNNGEITITDADLINNGSFTGSGMVILDGSGGTNATLGELENLEIDITGAISGTGDGVIHRYLKLTNGFLTTGGHEISLHADASQTCLVHHVNGNIAGDVVAEQFIPQNGNPYGHCFIGPSVHDATGNGVSVSDLYGFNLIFGSWPNNYYYVEGTGYVNGYPTYTISPGTGYYVYTWIGANGKLFDFEGELNSGNGARNVTNTGGTYAGYNLMSNPFHSPIDLEAVATYDANAPTKFWRYNNKQYQSYLVGIGGAPSISTDPTNISNILPACQGFWIHTHNNKTISFDNSVRITDPDAVVDPMAKTTFPLFRLALEGQPSDIINSVVYFYNGATDGLDNDFDAFYMKGDMPIQFATKTGNTDLCINALPELDLATVTIPLSTEVTDIGNYTISLTEFSNFPNGSRVLLQDLMLSTSHDLTHGPYTFLGNPVDGIDRFIITVLSNTVNTDLVEDGNLFDVYKCGDNLCVSLSKALNDDQAIRIYNALGQDLYSSTLQKGQQFFNLSNVNLPDGNVYFVDIDGYEKATKIVWGE